MPVEHEQRMVADREHAISGITPIRIDEFVDGAWRSLGYAAGFGAYGSIISLAEWRKAVERAPNP